MCLNTLVSAYWSHFWSLDLNNILSLCNRCGENKCVPAASSPAKPNSGVSKGALAGGVVGAILFLALSIAFFLRYRRRYLVKKALAQRDVKDVPAPAALVLNRPDPIEKSASELTSSTQTTNLTSVYLGSHQFSSSHPLSNLPPPPPVNPFDDANSIQTAVTEGTNVIPIALISPESRRTSLSSSDTSSPSATSSGPVRPPRSPDINLNLDHVNVSHDNLRRGAPSTRSGASGMSRNSYMSSASYSSEFMNEAPVIVSSGKGAVRQVIGVTKAEVMNASAASSDSLKPPAYGRVTARSSPLAASSFGPDDTVKESDENQEGDPFTDNDSNHASYALSPSPSSTTFGHQVHSNASHLPPSSWGRGDIQSRPSSMNTQAGSVVDIASATRVNVGLKTAVSASTFRTTMGRLVTPEMGTFQEQQHRAIAHAQTQAHSQGLHTRRISASSAVSNTADSILESFPFVPPSPISDRPVRSPPVSPLGNQSFASSPNNQHTFVVAPPTPVRGQAFGSEVADSSGLDSPLPPPNRRMLGLSTGSQLSTASSGLGSFPFQIDTEPTEHSQPTAYNGRQRASLDTLALTNDLSSYPLDFDRDSIRPPLPNRK